MLTCVRPWLIAISLTLFVVAGLIRIESKLKQQIVPQKPIVVIGSSLTGYAIAPKGINILGDGRAHARLYDTGLKEAEALDLLEIAIATTHIQTLIVEIYPFIRDFRSEHHSASKHNGLRAVGIKIIRGCRYLKQSLEDVSEYTGLMKGRKALLQSEAHLNRRLGIDIGKMQRIYPLYPRPPRQSARLHRLINAARARHIDVIFLATPRASTAERWNGKAARAGLAQQMQAFSKDYDVSVIGVTQIWADSYFIDHAHLNLAGRARFTSSLTATARVRHVS